MNERVVNRDDRQRREKVRLLLWDWGQTLELIDRKRAEIASYERWAMDAAETLGAQRLTGMPNGSRISDSVSRAVLELEKRRKMFDDASVSASSDIEALLQRKHAIDTLIGELPAIKQKILRLRYEDGHMWRFIALKVNFDESSVRRLESSAVDMLAQRLLFGDQE